ncbi:NAD(P)-binding Rossmann-fold containing protein [Mycena sanguinolenta]|uniref:NAD(P)-binding Rossmann-fold containing protein n=1 Tax=Mycena sanguinolenta TaxID=230812 RepID=A0A8H6ZER1_9AGAR|nr:NAD(P)-binding Rossmann-fold containing protein [Mycena sanguinolenta]
MAHGKTWTWCELRPDVVIGFVPNNNVYCLAQDLAPFLSLYRAIEGTGAELPFPGTAKSWTNLSNDSSQDIIAKFAIFASLHPEKCGGQSFNVADNHKPSSWSQRWPVICEYFGLKGVAPPPGGSGPQPGEYVQAHLAQWKELEQKHGLQTGRVGNDRSFVHLPYGMMTLMDFDRQLDMSKELGAWGVDAIETDTKGAWWTTFDRFRKAKIMP